MNILLADDHTLFRESLAMFLEITFPDSSITSTESWSGVCGYTDNHFYDLLLLDLFMSDVGSDCWLSSLSRVVSSQKGAICIISASNNRAHIQDAFDIGVKGYICKTSTLQQVGKALRQISRGKTYLPEQMWQKSSDAEDNKNSVKLTWRQREILELLVAGDSNKVIAQKLGLAESTVKCHLYNTYRLLGARNRVDVIGIAQRQHLVSS